jgi:hypothetical protein
MATGRGRMAAIRSIESAFGAKIEVMYRGYPTIRQDRSRGEPSPLVHGCLGTVYFIHYKVQTLFGSWAVVRTWGRLGGNWSQSRVEEFSTKDEATVEVET